MRGWYPFTQLHTGEARGLPPGARLKIEASPTVAYIWNNCSPTFSSAKRRQGELLWLVDETQTLTWCLPLNTSCFYPLPKDKGSHAFRNRSSFCVTKYYSIAIWALTPEKVNLQTWRLQATRISGPYTRSHIYPNAIVLGSWEQRRKPSCPASGGHMDMVFLYLLFKSYWTGEIFLL